MNMTTNELRAAFDDAVDQFSKSVEHLQLALQLMRTQQTQHEALRAAAQALLDQIPERCLQTCISMEIYYPTLDVAPVRNLRQEVKRQYHITPATDLVAHLHRQRQFSLATFGPGPRTAGVIDHIRKKLIEIEQAPSDISEWIDVVLLALDGAWRAGYTPEEIADALNAKQFKNEARDWPDWRQADAGKAIEHVRS